MLLLRHCYNFHSPLADATAVASASVVPSSQASTTPKSFTCSQLIALGNARNIKTTAAPSNTAGFSTDLCTLTRPNARGSFSIPAAAVTGSNAAAKSDVSNTTVGITTAVIRYLEQGVGSTITVSGDKGRRTVIRSTNATLAASTAGCWSPKAASVKFASLARSASVELGPFAKGAAVQIISVDLTTAIVPSGTEPKALMKEVPAVLGSGSVLVGSSPVVGLSSNDIYKNVSGGDDSVEVQRIRMPRIKVSQNGEWIVEMCITFAGIC
jgi:hypothetical protein